VIGAGHNGLVSGFYLARSGLRTVVVERRSFVGGACVTEEFAPGYRASTGAYVLSMLREAVWRDMRLLERGIRVDPAGPSLHLYPDGARFVLDDDLARTVEETKRFSAADGRALVPFEAHLGRIGRALRPVLDLTPPALSGRGLRGIPDLARFGGTVLRHRRLLGDAMFMFTTSASQFLSERFESEHVKAALGWHSINDSVHGPSSPGTAYALLHDHASDEGGVRQWGFVRGGMGMLTAAMGDAVLEAGGEIRTDAEVARIAIRGGRASGVVLSSGEEIEAPRLMSNADPKRTFLQLCEESELPEDFVAAIRAYRCEGTSIKINLAVSSLPYVRGLPGNGPQEYHRGVMEITSTLDDMDADQAEARAGVPAQDSHVELCFPTVHDPSLAPEGKHIVTIDVNSQPYSLRDGTWDDVKDVRADAVVAQLAQYFPELPDLIEQRQVLSPLDLERVLGLTGGHALHGEMTPDQLFFMRPVRGFGDYRTPIRGLYLCGAGAHPGGGVTGAPGRNAAREVLRDARGSRW
jgi:phytoene dehydrogenase-like protein